MTSAVSQLDMESENQLLKLFANPVKLGLLYKASTHGYNYRTLMNKFDGEGKYVIIIYFGSDTVRGVYLSKALGYSGVSDPDAFLFDVNNQGATKYPVLEPSKAVYLEKKECGSQTLLIGNAINIDAKNVSNVEFCNDADIYTSTDWPDLTVDQCEVELHRVQDVGHLLPKPWRCLSWTESARNDLMGEAVSFIAPDVDLPRVRALLLGPEGAGKSSFIVSARSVMYNRVVHQPIVGKAGGFTKKMTTYEIRAGKRGSPTALSLCDVMAIGDKDSPALSFSDALAVVKGHVPEGYKFKNYTPISDNVSGYCSTPSLKEQIHCVLFVLDASKVASYSRSLCSTLRELHSEISDLCIPQLILLTHIDQVCHAVHEDVKYVYSSRTLKETMEQAAELVHMPVSSVLPIKNYASEHSVNCNTDILLLDAICQILHAVDDMLEDQFPTAVLLSTTEPSD